MGRVPRGPGVLRDGLMGRRGGGSGVMTAGHAEGVVEISGCRSHSRRGRIHEELERGIQCCLGFI